MVEIGLIDLEIFLFECECGVLVKTKDKEERIIDTDEFKREFKTLEFKKIYYIDENETKIMLIYENDVQIIIEMV